MNDGPGERLSASTAPGDAHGAAALARHLAAAATVTEGLEAWCEARGLGRGPIRVLRRVSGAVPRDLDDLLGAAGEPRAFRQVVLGRGGIALVEAENLFLPGRLPPAMRAALALTETPFGAVIATLRPRRETIRQRIGGDGARVVLEQVARVRGPDGVTLAAVRERFLAALLG